MQRQHNVTACGAITALISVLWLAPESARADFEDYLSERWYTVEIAVFKRRSIGDDNTLESLSDPEPARFATNLGAFTGYSHPPLDSNTARMLRRTANLVGESGPIAFTMPELPVELDTTTGEPIEPDPQALFDAAVPVYEAHLHSRHLRLLEGQSPRLEPDLARLLRRRDHEVIWSGSWLQAVPARNAAQPLHVRGGEDFGERSELEGSIALGVGRYLHLGLDLWYHDPNFGAQALASAQAEKLRATTATDGEPETAATAVAEPATTAPASGDAIPVVESDPYAMQPLPRPDWLPQAKNLDPAAPRYMHLRTKRRMRSGDLHYIDHPKLGVLVRIDRVPPPEALAQLYESLDTR